MTNAADHDPAGFAPGTHGCHEALHVTDMMVDILDRHLRQHPAILSRPAWAARVDRAMEELATLYQEIGAAHLDPEDGQAARTSGAAD